LGKNVNRIIKSRKDLDFTRMPKVWDWGFCFCQEKFLICCFFERGWLISGTFVLVFICKHCFKLQNFGILFLPRGVFDLMFGFWVVWVILRTFILGVHLQVHCFKLQELRIFVSAKSSWFIVVVFELGWVIWGAFLFGSIFELQNFGILLSPKGVFDLLFGNF
jgi:hypothetical protein